MTAKTPRLPGITREPTRSGRVRRGVDAWVRARDVDQALTAALRLNADGCDHEWARLRSDSERSGAVLGQLLGKLYQGIALANQVAPEEVDDSDPIADVYTDLGYTPPS